MFPRFRTPRFSLTREFGADVSRLRAYNQRHLRTRAVPVSAIQGTVGRPDLCVPSRLAEWRKTSRYRKILHAVSVGTSLPPVELYLLDGHYYIRDGHHRVAVAHELGILDVDAEVIECLPTADPDAAAWHTARSAFELDTGLGELHVRRPDGYDLLRRQIAEHAWYLGERDPTPRGFVEAAARWEREIYRPVVGELDRYGVLDRVPDLTATELYLAVCDHKWYRGERLDRDVGFAAAVLSFARLQRPGWRGRMVEWIERACRLLDWLAESPPALRMEL